MGTLKVNGDISATGNISASSFLGNASSASKWATARTIKIGKTGKSVDGSSNVSWTHYEIGVPYCYDTSPTGSPAYSHWGMLISREENKYGQSGTGDNYFIGVNSNSQLHIGHQLNGTSIITWTNILSEHNYSSYALPLSGGTMSGSPVIKFPASAGSIAASDPMAITYGRISAYGTLCINADTDNSGNEYIILTAGKGLSFSTSDGLAIGQSTLTWQGANVITSGNISSYSAGSTTTLACRWHNNTVTSPAPDCGLVYDANMLYDTPGLFPVVHNGNAMITFNKHSGAHDSQLGFSGNGRIYYRNFNGSALNTTAGWNTIAFTSDTVAGANYASVAGAVDWANITNKPGSFNPSSHTHYNIGYQDTRGDNMTPGNCPEGLSVHLKTNGTDGLTDGGTYHPIFIIKDWGDYSGGPYGQISITANNNMWFRASSSNDSWSSWRNVIHSGNIGSQSVNYATSAGSTPWATESGYAGVAGVVRGTYTGNGGAQGPNYIGRSNVKFNMMNAFSGGPVVNYMDCILMNTYGGGDVPRATGIGVERYSGHLWVAEGSDTSGSWAQVYKAWTSKNMRVGQGQPTHSAEYGDVYFQY